MAASDMKITFDIEPLVKVRCKSFYCRHNLSNLGHAACNLKHIAIVEGGVCQYFENNKLKQVDKQ